LNLLEALSGFAVRHLPRERTQALRESYLSLRGRMAPVQRWLHGSFDVAALRAHLEVRVGRDFEVLMVHSSVNHMRPMFTGEALELVRMLMDYCGPQRTLAMPAFYFGDPELGGVVGTFRRNPRFDLRRTPSQMGLATELFRRTPGVVSSRHPVYRICAYGPLAEPLTRGHELATGPAGRGSPFEFMAARDTCIIGLGKPMQVLTQAHHTEGLMGDEFPLPWREGEPVEMTLIDRGAEIPFTLRNRDVAGRFDIWKLRAIMAPGTLHEWNFHKVPMFCTRARSVTEQSVAAARRGITLYDPL
jgi:aminoglycoside 3-N-acetyltransferase